MQNKERIAELKDRLREAMMYTGVKAIELSERTGVPKGAISYYLSGKSNPKADRLHQIAVSLDVSEAWLMGFDVPRERTESQKKNDDLVKVIAKLRRNPDLSETVCMLSELSAEDYVSVKRIIVALAQK